MLTPALFMLRVVDTLTLALVTASTALALSHHQGVEAYSRFVSVSVLGGALGGFGAFLILNVLRRHWPAPLSAVVAGSARIVLASAFGMPYADVMPLLYVAGFMLTLSSVVLMSMFHSLTSVRSSDMRARTSLLAASATGGLLGAPLAGAIVEANQGGPLLAAQLVGAAAALVVAFRFHRAFSASALAPQPVQVPPWHLLRPIAWRVPVIAGLSFSLGSLAPGVLTEAWSPQVGGFAAAAYLTGAVTGAVVLRAADRGRPRQAVEALRSHRWWFLPTALGTLMWLFLLGPAWVSLLATLAAGAVLHLVQAGFEQAAADTTKPEASGPSIVALHSVAGIATALGLTFLPRAIDGFGLTPVVGAIAAGFGVLALRDSLGALRQRA